MNPLFDAQRLARMPAHFGPSPGPRQNLEPFAPDHGRFPKTFQVGVTALTRREQLARLLPPGFEVWGEPLLIVEFKYLTEIEWLAGRGYNILGIRTPVVHAGRSGRTPGFFQLIYWENLTDPILTGRDEVGAPKIYADIPEARFFQGEYVCSAGWLGHKFFEMRVGGLREGVPSAVGASKLYDEAKGLILYKYMPKTGAVGETDASYATLSPAGNSKARLERGLVGQGSFAFRRSTFEELPTMYHIVNALADLDFVEMRDAGASWIVGGRDFADTVILD